ncbi:MAG: N-acetyltransferase family protein [Haloarculaceae archaeon]
MTDRIYPEEPAGSFPAPPLSVTDGEGRTIEIRTVDAGAYEDLVEMYRDFDPADRAQGIPPVSEDAIRDWLEALLDQGSYNVVALHEGSPVGHAILVPDDTGAYELAVFVLHDYQNAGIGTHLLEALLGRGQEAGVERVWLTVERWNEPAIALYKKLGFETCDAESFELEMSIRL